MGATFQYIFRCLAIELSCLAITGNMFLPKVVGIFGSQDFDHFTVSHSFIKSQPVPGSEIESVASAKPPSSPRRFLSVSGRGNGEAEHQIIDGSVCVRYASTRWGLSFTSWRAVKIGVVPNLKLLFLFAPQGAGPTVSLFLPVNHGPN
ncbi:hypothetical protein HDU67_010137 [Dinochytrium kinnereticum]|nr:hypothetical protein HDU67_010137 [Dinochytrium kinnereticum]